MLAFSEALIEELRGSGVTVTAVCPPPVRTPFVSAAQIVSANYMATTKITPAEVARYGYQMMKRGKPVAVYSLRWRLVTAFLVRITPRFGLRRLLDHMNRPRRRFISACCTRRRLTVKESFHVRDNSDAGGRGVAGWCPRPVAGFTSGISRGQSLPW